MANRATRPQSALRDFLKSEASGGIVLMAAAALAMLFANLPGISEAYFGFLHWETGPVISPKYGPMTVHLWINDALMAIFFLLVGLEIKREFVDGRLATWEHRRLPILAAAGGMLVPALVYLGLSSGTPGLTNGWAIPAATDIAFAIGVLALLGPRAPTALKLFLVTVAIVDDMGAVAIIAIAYTESISSLALGAAALIMGVMYVMGRSGVQKLWPYLLLGAVLWYFVFLSGVHATIAGVALAMMIPIKKTPGAPEAVDSPLHRLEHKLHGPSAFFVVPLFGFANAGVSLAGVEPSVLVQSLPLGIAAGLFIGKQVGIFGTVWVAIKLGLGTMPRGTSWRQIYGMSMIAGIGFTMSLFIGGLAFPGNAELIDDVKIGVLFGSILSAIGGYLVLRTAPVKRGTNAEQEATGEPDF
ncbi:Na+/H+ antiporter NhaA [Sphingomonas sp. AX6]|uniref:Na+/H+ antiporter NhaA n=1 Tax=Sphingomonas sp. AX6 TaxID=2653171 RepID=UPI0012F1139D|nr:Na+/H+ antiporter NhaA [Sphingomonas sp. AX6]VXC55389.1 sodium-proton antiporter [Sphingomonas sp. AX6]